MIGIAAVLIGARIYLRLVIQNLPLITSDILVCVAWLFTVASASYDIVFHRMGVLRSHVAYTLEGYEGTPEDLELVWKVSILDFREVGIPIPQRFKGVLVLQVSLITTVCSCNGVANFHSSQPSISARQHS